MFNNDLAKQLQRAITEGKIKPKYFDGYQQWKQKFDYFYEKTHDVTQTLNIMYGPGGSVNDYKGSIYVNSNVVVNKSIVKKVQKPEQKKSGSLSYLRIKK